MESETKKKQTYIHNMYYIYEIIRDDRNRGHANYNMKTEEQKNGKKKNQKKNVASKKNSKDDTKYYSVCVQLCCPYRSNVLFIHIRRNVMYQHNFTLLIYMNLFFFLRGADFHSLLAKRFF